MLMLGLVQNLSTDTNISGTFWPSLSTATPKSRKSSRGLSGNEWKRTRKRYSPGGMMGLQSSTDGRGSLQYTWVLNSVEPPTPMSIPLGRLFASLGGDGGVAVVTTGAVQTGARVMANDGVAVSKAVTVALGSGLGVAVSAIVALGGTLTAASSVADGSGSWVGAGGIPHAVMKNKARSSPMCFMRRPYGRRLWPNLKPGHPTIIACPHARFRTGRYARLGT